MKSRKKRRGLIFIIIGAVCVVAALSLVVYNAWDDRRAGDSVEEALVQLTGHIEPPLKPAEGETYIPDYQLDPYMEMPTETIDGWEYIGTLSVPSLDLELPVMSGWSYPGLRLSPCRYAGSAYQDNMILAAHNYARHFGGLKDLSIGSTVRFTDILANEFTYEVSEVTVIEPTAIEEMTSGEWDLSLFTCTKGGAARVTVRCDKVSEQISERYTASLSD